MLTLRLVNRAIDLDNKPSARREEIDDVAIERMLPTKANAEPTTAKLRPEKCFAASGLPAHLASAMKEKRRRGAVVVVHALAKRKIHDSAFRSLHVLALAGIFRVLRMHDHDSPERSRSRSRRR